MSEHGPQSGVMHPVDRAFYDLTIKERNYERFKVDRLEAEVKFGRELVRALRQACRDTGSPVVPTPVAEALRALSEWADPASNSEAG